LLLLSPTPLHAGKNKGNNAPPPVPLGQQRTKGYFDPAKIVWPNPPAIPRITFKDLYTGEKIDPNLFTKKASKATWMDRLAGTLPAEENKAKNLPFQLIRTYGVGVDSMRQTRVWVRSSSSTRRRRIMSNWSATAGRQTWR
jgi:hypothetical protein